MIVLQTSEKVVSLSRLTTTTAVTSTCGSWTKRCSWLESEFPAMNFATLWRQPTEMTATKSTSKSSRTYVQIRLLWCFCFRTDYHQTKAPSTPATMSKQLCRMLYKSTDSFDNVEMLLRQSRTLLRCCCWYGWGFTFISTHFSCRFMFLAVILYNLVVLTFPSYSSYVQTRPFPGEIWQAYSWYPALFLPDIHSLHLSNTQTTSIHPS